MCTLNDKKSHIRDIPYEKEYMCFDYRSNYK